VSWRTSFTAAAIVVASGLVVPVVAQAETSEWHATVLPLPEKYPDGQVWLSGTDSNGNYSGTLLHSDGRYSVVLYDGDQPVVVGAPRGCDSASVADQNSSGLVVGTAYDCENSIQAQAFVYQNGTFSLLTPPGEYTAAQVFDVNDRGEILASAWAPDTTLEPANVVWSPFAAQPIIIEDTLEWQYATAIDHDGTLLLTSRYGPAIWRDGEVTLLPVPIEYTAPTASSIADGQVVGTAVSIDTVETVSLYWPTPTSTPRELKGPGEAYHVNRSGLVVGNYPSTTWDNGMPAGTLPVPEGFSDVQAEGVGDDGTVFGEGGEVTVAPGTPVIWRRG
jgi:hypothetical protein